MGLQIYKTKNGWVVYPSNDNKYTSVCEYMVFDDFKKMSEFIKLYFEGKVK